MGEDFRKHGFANRTVMQLQSLWRDLKKKAKTALAEEKRGIFKTGGGQNSFVMDAISKLVLEILPSGSLGPLTGINDDDAVIHDKEVMQEKKRNVVYENKDSSERCKREGSKEVAQTSFKKMKVEFNAKEAAQSEHQLKMEILRQRLLFDQEEHKARMGLYDSMRRRCDSKTDWNQGDLNESNLTSTYMSYLGTLNESL